MMICGLVLSKLFVEAVVRLFSLFRVLLLLYAQRIFELSMFAFEGFS